MNPKLLRAVLVWVVFGGLANSLSGQGFYGTPRDDIPKTANQIPAVELPAPTPLKLPAVVDEIVVGGSGKFLIAHLNTLQTPKSCL